MRNPLIAMSSSISRCSGCSTDFQSAVAQVSNLQTVGCAGPADWKSAIQQVRNLRYKFAVFVLGFLAAASSFAAEERIVIERPMDDLGFLKPIPVSISRF